MSLTPEWIATKNPVDMNGICNAIRDYFLEHASEKPICMTCGLAPTVHEDSGLTTWDGPIVFRVNNNDEEVLKEYKAILAHFNPSNGTNNDPHQWRLMNDIHSLVTTVETCVLYPDWQPVKAVKFTISLVNSEFQIKNAPGCGVNEWGWHPTEMKEYDQKHLTAMLQLWLQVKPVPEEV